MMRCSRWQTFVFALLFAASALATYQQNRNLYCQAVDTSTFAISPSARASLRSSNSFTMTLSLTTAFTSYTSGGVSAFLTGSGYVTIIFIVIALACLGSALTFIISNCACQFTGPRTTEAAKGFCLSAVILWLVAIGGMVALIVYIKMVQNDFPTMICGVSTAGYQIVIGLSTASGQFIGFKTYSTLLGSFNLDLSGLNSVNPNFANVQSAMLGVSAQASVSALQTFYNNYYKSTTSNATNQQSIPFSVGNFTKDTVSSKIQSQFSQFTGMATRLDNSSLTAIGMTSNQQSALSSALVLAAPYYLNVSVSIDAIFNTLSDNFTSIESNMNTVFWSVLISQIVVLLIGLISIVCLSRMAFQKDCLGRIKTVRIFVFIAGILVFGLALVASLNVLVSLILNTVCGVTQEMLTSPQTLNATLNLASAGTVAQVWSYCAANVTTSQMSNLYQNTTNPLPLMEQILDGITLYSSQYQDAVTASKPTILTSISDTINSWAAVYNGVAFDQPLILETYQTFVYQNNQSDIQYVFNRNNCTISKCYLIQNVTNFTASENANNITYVNQLFQALRNYITSEIQLMNNMANDLTASVSTSPNSALQSTLSKLLSVNGNITVIRGALRNSLSTVASFQGGLLNYTNCSAMINSFNDLEYTSCFAFRTNLLVLSLLTILTAIVEIVVLWLIWLGLRQIKGEESIEYATTEDMSLMNNGGNEKSRFGKRS